MISSSNVIQPISHRRIHRLAWAVPVLAGALAVTALLPAAKSEDMTFSTPGPVPSTQPGASAAKNKTQSSGLEIQPLADEPIIDYATGKIQPPASQPINMLREGQTLSDRIGRLSAAPDSPYMQFTLEPLGNSSQPGQQSPQQQPQHTAGLDAIPGMTLAPPPPPLPLLVLPNQQLMQMEYALRDSGRDLRFRVTGTITEYHDRNYILIDKVGFPPPDAAGTQPSGASASASPAAPAASHPLTPRERLDQQLQPLKQQGSAGPGLPPLPDQNSPETLVSTFVAPSVPVSTLLREGRTIIDRTGRLTRGQDGQTMMFTFDADRRAMRDPPLIILPNEKLQQMENAVRDSQRDERFRISGFVTEYEGRNYVLLEKVLVIPQITQQF